MGPKRRHRWRYYAGKAEKGGGVTLPRRLGGGGGEITKPGRHGGGCNKLGRQRREMRGEGRLLCPEEDGGGGGGEY